MLAIFNIPEDCSIFLIKEPDNIIIFSMTIHHQRWALLCCGKIRNYLINEFQLSLVMNFYYFSKKDKQDFIILSSLQMGLHTSHDAITIHAPYRIFCYINANITAMGCKRLCSDGLML